MFPLTVDICSLVHSQARENKRLGLVTMEGLAPDVERVLFSDKIEILGFLIPLDLVELPSWCVSLRRGGKLLPLRYRSLPEFVQWEILKKRFNTVFINSLTSLRNEDLSWLADLLHTVHELAGVNHVIINITSFSVENWAALLSRLRDDIAFSITNYNYRVSNYFKEFEEVEKLLRRNPKLRWAVNYKWFCKNICGFTEYKRLFQFRRMRGSLSGVLASVSDLTDKLNVSKNIINKQDIGSVKLRKLELDLVHGLPLFVYHKNNIDSLPGLFNLVTQVNEERANLISSL
jgi:hypothetical protein